MRKRHFNASEEMCLNKIRITGCEGGGSLWWGLVLEQILCVCVCVAIDKSPACMLRVQESLYMPCHMINVLSPIIYVFQNMMYVRMNFEL